MPRRKNLKGMSMEQKRRIKEYYFNGRTRAETAEKFGLVQAQVDIIAKDRRVLATNSVASLLQTWKPS